MDGKPEGKRGSQDVSAFLWMEVMFLLIALLPLAGQAKSVHNRRARELQGPLLGCSSQSGPSKPLACG